MSFARRALRDLEAEASEPLPEPWAMAADVVRAELEDRERRRGLPPGPLAGLSPNAAAVLALLHGLEHGRTYVERLHARVEGAPVVVDLWTGLDELVGVGLLEVSWAVDEDGEMVEPIVELRYDVDLPDVPGEEG